MDNNRAAKFRNLSNGLNIATIDKNGMVKVACYRHCGNLNSLQELFEDFGPLLKLLQGLVNPVGSLYCSTFKPSNVHSSGPIGYGVSIENLRGMAGILQFQEHVRDITAPYDRVVVVKLQCYRAREYIFFNFVCTLILINNKQK